VCSVTLTAEIALTTAGVLLWLLLDIPAEARERMVFAGGSGLGIFLLLPIYRFKATRAIGYAVREHDLILKSGLFWQKEVIQPIRRIQHVELTRGPLEKRLGFANVRLFSAGSARATFTIPGLRLITAARIRRHVLSAEQH
jgi:membrane protein YdbS with pleckstrin-like domain